MVACTSSVANMNTSRERSSARAGHRWRYNHAIEPPCTQRPGARLRVRRPRRLVGRPRGASTRMRIGAHVPSTPTGHSVPRELPRVFTSRHRTSWHAHHPSRPHILGQPGVWRAPRAACPLPLARHGGGLPRATHTSRHRPEGERCIPRGRVPRHALPASTGLYLPWARSSASRGRLQSRSGECRLPWPALRP